MHRTQLQPARETDRIGLRIGSAMESVVAFVRRRDKRRDRNKLASASRRKNRG